MKPKPKLDTFMRQAIRRADTYRRKQGEPVTLTRAQYDAKKIKDKTA